MLCSSKFSIINGKVKIPCIDERKLMFAKQEFDLFKAIINLLSVSNCK